jgi:hypothetical protein
VQKLSLFSQFLSFFLIFSHAISGISRRLFPANSLYHNNLQADGLFLGIPIFRATPQRTPQLRKGSQIAPKGVADLLLGGAGPPQVAIGPGTGRNPRQA